MVCPKCSREIPAEAAFCPNCGAQAPPQGIAGAAGLDEIELFVGKRAAYYKARFRKFDVGGVETFALTWNWAAFLANFWWMLYRKLYLWALVWFLLTSIPYFGFAFWIASGLAGNYLYYRHASAKIREAKSVQVPEKLPEMLRELGGTNEWVVVVGIVVTAAILIAAILFGIGFGLFCTLANRGTPI